jgi:hypothetical protein
VLISVKSLGKDKSLLPDWSLPLPPDQADGGEAFTLRALITRIVVAEVEAYRKRQTQRRLVRVLTEREIAQGAERGKVDAGGRDFEHHVDTEEAVGAALQAFGDGLYLVILDGVEQRQLDKQVYVKDTSALVFLRLVMLAGA